MRYNLLDQRLYGIDNNFSINYNTNQDPIQIINVLSTLNQRFTDYQEFLVLMKNSMNVIGSYTTVDTYSTLLTQFKVNSTSMTDLDIFNGWNSFLLNYGTNYNYNFASIITGISNSINLYNIMSSTSLDFSSLGYELTNFINNFYVINQRNFSNLHSLRYETGSVYNNLITELDGSLSLINSINIVLDSILFIKLNNF
jgi:hypothetical protein